MDIRQVILLELGRHDWPRWMIYHAVQDRYWSKGRWVERPRDAELWNDKAEAYTALKEATLFNEGAEDE